VTCHATAAYILGDVSPRSTVVRLGALALLVVPGCGGQSRVSVSQPTHSAVAFADVVEIPNGTPPWLINDARRMALGLHDAHPQRVRIRLGRVDVIEMWGRFLCDRCSRPAGAKAPRGAHAEGKFNSRTHRPMEFGLTPR
jgi:hypothetical protein